MFLLQFNMPDRLPRGGRPRLQVRPPRNPRLGGECRRHSVRNGMLKSNKDRKNSQKNGKIWINKVSVWY